MQLLAVCLLIYIHKVQKYLENTIKMVLIKNASLHKIPNTLRKIIVFFSICSCVGSLTSFTSAIFIFLRISRGLCNCAIVRLLILHLLSYLTEIESRIFFNIVNIACIACLSGYTRSLITYVIRDPVYAIRSLMYVSLQYYSY